jgi:hypothetical protein
MIYEIPSTKKLWNGKASVRDYLVKRCLSKGQDLVILYRGKKMTLTHEALRGFTQWNKRTFKSKFSSKEYGLYDFTFVADDSKVPLAVEEKDKAQAKLF